MNGICKLCEAKKAPITFFGCCAGCNAIYDTEKIQGMLWMKKLFEHKNCEECNKGIENHKPIKVLGNWFAECQEVDHD